MDAGRIERIETGVGRGASAIFAGAIGYAAYGLLGTIAVEPQLGLCAAGAGALAFLPCSRALGARRRGAGFVLPEFGLRDFEFTEDADELLLTERLAPAGELVLTDSDRLEADVPLALDDILAELEPESRVVRLFDPKAMPPPPTPGQLQSRIADHLGDGAPRSAPSKTPASDASQALSAALAELRRSLR